MYSTYGGFLNDPTAQMGFQVGKTAVMAGQEYVESNVYEIPIHSSLTPLRYPTLLSQYTILHLMSM